MPYKCSVKDCRSNFDSTSERVTVFNFPKDEETLARWLNNVELKAKSVTKSSRICIKHFSPHDIDSNFRNLLKPNAIPLVSSNSSSSSDPAIECEDQLDFGQLCDEIEERFGHLNLLMDANGMCIYKLEFNREFTDVIVGTRIIVNKDMGLRAVIDGAMEHSYELQSLSHLIDLIELHFSSSKSEAEDEETVVVKEGDCSDNEESIDFSSTIVETDEECYVETTEGDVEKDDDLIEFIDPLKCENCSIKFINVLGLQHHKKTCTHLKVIAFNCKICNENFPSILQLRLHQKKTHASVNKIKCHLCNLVLVNTASLNRHFRAVHLMIRPHKCSVCNKTFATSSTKISHEKTHEKNIEMEQFLNKHGDGLYCCPNCDEKFSNSHQLRNHLDKNCYQPPRKRRIYKYPCKFCVKQFGTKIKAATHYREEHNVNIKNPQKFCFECNVEVDDYSNHIRIHTCQYSCSYCGLKFLTEETCSQHEAKQHPEPKSEARPFHCPYCSASFKTEHHLKSHVASYHSQVEKEFGCEICRNRFMSRSLLEAHMRTHKMMFTCRICQKTFKKLLNLKNHSIAMHQTDEIYCCEIDSCQERFKLLQELKNHQTNHGVSLNIQKYFSERH